jgi:hypothetical protein
MKVMKLLGPVLIASTLAVTAGCAGHDDGKGKTPPTGPEVATAPPEEPEPEAPPASAKVQVAVTSVQLQDDCPSPKAPSAGAAAEPMRMEKAAMQQEDAAGDVADEDVGLGLRGCIQSRVQFSIESESDQALAFSVKAVRLKKAEGDDVFGTMNTREPTVWEDSKYQPWDQSIAAGASLKVGYAIGAPDWGKVEKALGESTWGPMYVVEFEVEIDGDTRTLVSPQVPRDEPENIVT